MMKLKILLITLMSIVNMYGYSVGDKIDNDLSKQLLLKKDKIYIVDFFASWCSSCKVELPIISKLNATIEKSKYQIIGINSDTNMQNGKKFVQDLKLNFNVIYDTNNKIISKFNPIGVPAIYYIKNNIILKVVYGAVDNIDKKILTDLKSMDK